MPCESKPAKKLDYPSSVVIVLIVAVYGISIMLKGPTLDEFWTLLYTDPHISRSVAWRWWSSDTGHPLFYYFIMRLFFNFLPENVTTGRALNVIPLIVFVIVAKRASLTGAAKPFVVIFTVILLCTYITIERFSEMRAFFWGIALLASLLVILRLILARAQISLRIHIPTTAVTVGLACFDYMAFAAANAALCSVAVVLFALQRRADCGKIVVTVIIGWAVAGLSLWNALKYPVVPAPYHVDIKQFIVNLAVVVGLALMGNLVVTGAALRTAFRVIRRSTPVSERNIPGEWEFVVSLGLSVALAVGGYAILNLLSHIMVKRQLFGLGILVCGLISALAVENNEVSQKKKWILPCMTATLAFCVVVLWQTPNFRRHGPALAEAQQKCPGYRIFALNYDDLQGVPGSLNRQHAGIALERGYNTIARDFGFQLSSFNSPREFDEKCGGAIWFEEAWLLRQPKIKFLLERLGFKLAPYQLAGARLQQEMGSVLITVPGRNNEQRN